MPESIHSPRRVDAKRRALMALEMRAGGASYRAIAENAAVGVKTASGAYRLVMRALKFTLQEPADKVRKLELIRLDRLQLAHWTSAKRGGERATEIILDISRRRARLLGLDMPLKIAPTDPEGDHPYESISDEERANRVMAILDTARARKARAANAGGEKPALGSVQEQPTGEGV